MTASTASPPSRWAALPVLLAALFVVTLDFFIVNVALPSMQRELDAGSSAVTMWVAGYGVAFAALLILGGRLGDRHGRRRMFVAGFGLFTLASAACGAAPDATTLVVARMGQGVGAALLSPQVLATIGVVYNGEDRVRAITAYGLVAGVAAVSGQLIGGALISATCSASAGARCSSSTCPSARRRSSPRGAGCPRPAAPTGARSTARASCSWRRASRCSCSASSRAGASTGRSRCGPRSSPPTSCSPSSSRASGAWPGAATRR